MLRGRQPNATTRKLVGRCDVPTREQLKTLVCEEIDRRGEEAIRVAQTILGHPEPGFREQKTARLVAEHLRRLGIPVREGIALTGVQGTLEGGSEGPAVAVMG